MSVLLTRCKACNRGFAGYGVEGICPQCQSVMPAFIPKDQLRNDTETPGYVYRANGAVRYDKSDTATLKGDAPAVAYRAPINSVFPHEPLPKRTPQQRLNSLHQRIADCISRLGGIPDSMLQEVRTELIAQGKAPLSMDQLRSLAGFYMQRADNEEEAHQRRLVTRTR